MLNWPVHWVQGLLAAMAAGLRAKLRQMQSVQPRLQTKARREKLHADISQASTAVQAALRVVQGEELLLCPIVFAV